MDNIKKIMNTTSDSFYGGVIYIDLRGYTNIVKEKPLKNVAEIIYSYQKEVKSIIKNSSLRNKISTIEFVGDGVMAIIKKDSYDKYHFANELFRVANKLRYKIDQLIQNMKENYSELDNLDFGIALSISEILKKTVSENNSSKRKLYFGNSLNRACKIGDSMNSKKNYIGIDKRIFDEIYLEKNYIKMKENDNYYLFDKVFVKEVRPFAHLILQNDSIFN
jgi:hypothetical protein